MPSLSGTGRGATVTANIWLGCPGPSLWSSKVDSDTKRRSRSETRLLPERVLLNPHLNSCYLRFLSDLSEYMSKPRLLGRGPIGNGTVAPDDDRFQVLWAARALRSRVRQLGAKVLRDDCFLRPYHVLPGRCQTLCYDPPTNLMRPCSGRKEERHRGRRNQTSSRSASSNAAAESARPHAAQLLMSLSCRGCCDGERAPPRVSIGAGSRRGRQWQWYLRGLGSAARAESARRPAPLSR